MVYVYMGSATGVSAMDVPTSINGSPGGDYFGLSVASAGDVNGDGFADLIVGGDDQWFILLAERKLNCALCRYHPPCKVFSSEVVVESAGDLNGDGFDDIVVVQPEVGTAYLYLGNDAGLRSRRPSLSLYYAGSDSLIIPLQRLGPTSMAAMATLVYAPLATGFSGVRRFKDALTGWTMNIVCALPSPNEQPFQSKYQQQDGNEQNRFLDVFWIVLFMR